MLKIIAVAFIIAVIAFDLGILLESRELNHRVQAYIHCNPNIACCQR